MLLLGVVFASNPVLRAQDQFENLATRAAAARDANDSKTAISLYQAALQVKPEWREGLWMAGSLLYDSDQFSDAAVFLTRLAALVPSAGAAWGLLGLCEYETRDFGPALQHISQSISLGMDNQPQMSLVLRFHEAALLTKFGRFETALEKYSGLIQGPVTDQQFILGLGLLSLRRPLAPSEATGEQRELYLKAGEAFSAFLANDQSKARLAYEHLAARYPDSADVHYAYGYFLFASDTAQAVEQWQRALAIEPSHAAANAMLAWTYSLRQEPKAAIDHAMAALKTDPELAVAQIVLGRELVSAGQSTAGLAHLEQAVRLQPGNLEAHLALATAYSETGRKTDAQRERQFCLQKQGETGVARP